MTIKEQLRSNFPGNIDKTKKEFCSLIANEDGNAVIESILTDLLTYMSEWKNCKDVYSQEGVMLDKSANLISYMERFTDESDVQFKNRINAIFVRHGDTTWGTPFNIKRVFEQYFELANVFVVENAGTEEDNLIQDFDFNSTESSNWKLNNAEICSKARFSKSFGVNFFNEGSCSQEITEIKKETPYYLHFFYKGEIKVCIQDDEGMYWNNHAWTNEKSEIKLESSEWKDGQIFFKNHFSSQILISFYGTENTYLDYIRLSEYKFPSFSVLIQIEGSVAKNALSLASGRKDPDENIDYEKAGYYDKSFLTGVAAGFAKDLYEDLLSYIKSTGIKGNLEIVNKDYSEN